MSVCVGSECEVCVRCVYGVCECTMCVCRWEGEVSVCMCVCEACVLSMECGECARSYLSVCGVMLNGACVNVCVCVCMCKRVCCVY